MHTDPIADFLIRLKNASIRGHWIVTVSASKMKIAIAEVLKDQGFIRDYKVVEEEGKPYKKHIKIILRYHPRTKEPAIHDVKRVSKPGRRIYVGVDKIPRVKNGMGIAILSTSKGIMHDKEARKQHVGGELLCYIW